MASRSWLLVPGDNDTKLVKAGTSGAEAIVLDLEDGVVPGQKAQARAMARDWLQIHRTQILESRPFTRWVRINSIDTNWWREDLATVMSAAPDGIIVPKATGPDQLQALSAELYEFEQRVGVPTNSTRIVPVVGEDPISALTIHTYATATLPRLAGLAWGAEDLASAIGASRRRDERGQWTDAFRMVRAQVLLTAHARGIMAIDALHPGYKDLEQLRAIASASRADGFTGMLAIHPAQVPVINDAFAATPEELAEARAIVDSFAASPGLASVAVGGRMVDQPQLNRAKRLLGLVA